MKIERELSGHEIKTLEKRRNEIRRRQNRLTRFVVAWTGICLIGGIIIGLFVNPELRLLLTLTALVLAGIGLWTFLQERTKDRRRLKQIEYLQTVNRVTSIKVRSREFYELTEEEDEGVYYLFQITPDEILCFGGQEFYSNKNFPSSDFEIVEGKGEDGQIVLLETYSHGDKISPFKKIEGKEKWDLLTKINFDEFQIINGRLGQFG